MSILLVSPYAYIEWTGDSVREASEEGSGQWQMDVPMDKY